MSCRLERDRLLPPVRDGLWIVVSSEADTVARWAADGLRARGLTPLECITTDLLPHAVWDHRITESGASLELLLADGRHIDSCEVRGVINRLQFVPVGHSVIACSDDQQYSQHEMAAFYLSWLNAFGCPVLNPASHLGMCGAVRHASDWLCLAARVGLNCPPYRLTSRQSYESSWLPGSGLPRELATAPRATLFTVGTKVVGRAGQPTPPDAVLQGAVELALRAKIPLLGLDFVVSSLERWTFVGADSLPDLTRGGDALLDALAGVLAPAETVDAVATP